MSKNSINSSRIFFFKTFVCQFVLFLFKLNCMAYQQGIHVLANTCIVNRNILGLACFPSGQFFFFSEVGFFFLMTSFTNVIIYAYFYSLKTLLFFFYLIGLDSYSFLMSRDRHVVQRADDNDLETGERCSDFKEVL